MAKNSSDIDEIVQGTTYPIYFENTLKDGTPIDLTGATVYFTAKKNEDSSTDDATAAIKKDVTTHVDEQGLPSAVLGISTILLTPTDTNKPEGSYNYDITVKYASIGGADPVVNTPIRGKLKIEAKSTNRST